MSEQVFPTRLAGALRWLSIGGTLLMVLVIAIAAQHVTGPWWFRSLVLGGPSVVLLVCVLGWPRGYVLSRDGLHVQRLFGRTRIAQRIDSAAADDDAFKGAWRVFANGGVFGCVGWFRSRRLGPFRAWVTDLSALVVVRHAAGCAVISPLDRAAFLAAVPGHNR